MSWKELPTYGRIWIWMIPIILVGALLDAKWQFNIENIQWSMSSLAWSLYISGFILFSGLGYFFFRAKGMNDYLSKQHIRYLSIGISIFVTASLALGLFFGDPDQLVHNGGSEESSLDNALVLSCILAITIIFAATLLYIVNLIITIFFQHHFSRATEN